MEEHGACCLDIMTISFLSWTKSSFHILGHEKLRAEKCTSSLFPITHRNVHSKQLQGNQTSVLCILRKHRNPDFKEIVENTEKTRRTMSGGKINSSWGWLWPRFRHKQKPSAKQMNTQHHPDITRRIWEGIETKQRINNQGKEECLREIRQGKENLESSQYYTNIR